MNLNRMFHTKQQLFDDFFVGKRVLDTASHRGQSSIDIAALGATSVVGIEVRPKSVEMAHKLLANTNCNNVQYICGDITDYTLLDKTLTEIDTVACFGVFYHLHDHFNFLKHICTSSCTRLVIETLFGLESPNPTMACVVESVEGNSGQQGVNAGFDRVMIGSPNIVWIQQVLEIFNWHIVYFVTDNYGDERMILGAVNGNKIDVSAYPKFPGDMWQWAIEPNSITGTKKFSIYE
jgi:hypothetical protein